MSDSISVFIERWKYSAAAERANYQLFLTELCGALGIEQPHPSSGIIAQDSYVFEHPVLFNDGEGHTSTGFIDLYKKDSFVLEAKQGRNQFTQTESELLGNDREIRRSGTATRNTRQWDRSMKAAKEQALRYARSLPSQEGWPPFLVVVDVGYCIDLYADFSKQGKVYVPFPDPLNYRIYLDDLGKSEVQDKLRLLFSKPLELDPAVRTSKVTRKLAEQLALLASSLENRGHEPEKVAQFLMRCLFTMFSEDVGLLPNRSFTNLLKDYRSTIEHFPAALQSLWFNMDKGGFEPALRTVIPQFNGYLFKEPEALPVTQAELDLLIKASEAYWAEVEPAIFGTLLERALSSRERHKLGAHYTPRSYVERLVLPAVIEPLREEWNAARTAAAKLEAEGNEAGAREAIADFHRRLCSIRVLDPACGSGNFLYVTLEHLKRLEGEVVETLGTYPGQQVLDMTGGFSVTPAQFLGLEVNPRAAAIADVVLWIGYLQWHFRTHGNAVRLGNPILREYGNIKCQDAIMAYRDRIARVDQQGNTITRWDGSSCKPHPQTGKDVPDESARATVYDYIEPSPAQWPAADFIIGNPPFIGDKAMRITLGDGYVDALRATYKGILPESADLVMYWWYIAAQKIRSAEAERFGFITTNSIKQTFNRRVLQEQMSGTNAVSIVYAIPDHPWVDNKDGAAVRIAITVGDIKRQKGRLLLLQSEKEGEEEAQVSFIEKTGNIHSDLTIGAEVASAESLTANGKICSFGMMLAGSGFIVSEQQARELGLGRIPELQMRIRPYRNGRDLTSKPRGVYLIDMYPLTEAETRDRFPEVYQHLLVNVKPERDHNNRKRLKEQWWLFGESRQGLRAALEGLRFYISTPETAKHRFFVCQDKAILPDHKLVNIALDDYFYFGVLSSKVHVLWADAAGGRMGVGNDPVYNTSRCFLPFPFPDTVEENKNSIRGLAERLDQHRKQRLEMHPDLSMTEMYNVLEKYRTNETLTQSERTIFEHGLISILDQLHRELDREVLLAYGWESIAGEESLLEALVALNKSRKSEEANGQIRWLRREFQSQDHAIQGSLSVDTSVAVVTTRTLEHWPESLSDQAKSIHNLLKTSDTPMKATDISLDYQITRKDYRKRVETQIAGLLETLHSLGLIRKIGDDRFIG